ncbi:hypothetical protein [Isoptericola croceus]|uniref:hypothetical protein n=1 Tax=Isoptericola croceus TaxID=3031406 RepID=UPI0023F7C348|nr:hypothetical protein [Isoptericola croceus]
MRTPLALGAAVLLTLGLGAGPAAATGGGQDRWEGPGDSRTGEIWNGGEATSGGKAYGWPEKTYSWIGDVCPDMDEPKTDTDDEPETVTLTAPEGKLISTYCVKSGSDGKGNGPKIVTLDVPQPEVEISYVADNKCKDISHYAVAYVDAPTPTPSPDDSTEPSPVPSGEPVVDPEPSPEPSGEPGTDPTPEVSEGPEGRPQTVVPVEPGSDEPRASEVAVDAEEDAPDVETVRAQTQAELPQTGPGRAIGIAVGALVLVGAGVGAVLFARSRRAGA